MKRILTVFLSLILLAGLRQSSQAEPANLTLLNDINISSSVDNTKIELKFDGKPRQEKILYHDDFVQIEFPDTYTDPPKQWHKVEDDIVKNIFVYQFDTTTVRVRLFSYGKAKSLKDRIKISKANNGLVIHYALGAAAGRDLPSASKKELKITSANKIKAGPLVEVNVPETTDVVLPSRDTESSDAGDGMANQDEAPAEQSTDKKVTDQPAKTSLLGKQDAGENKIELVNDTPGFTGSVIKMVTALGIVLSLLFGVVYLAKKFLGRKIGLSGQDQKIKVVTSTYLGPKKSIALVEVAGEKIVVGVTATHISMLTKIGRDEDFNEVLKEQIKTTDETDISQGRTNDDKNHPSPYVKEKGEGVTKAPSDEKVELQDELWEKV